MITTDEAYYSENDALVNSGMVTTTCLPPEITQVFSRILLTHSICLDDTLELLMEIFLAIEPSLDRKARHHPNSIARCNKLKKAFLDLYEFTKKKEEKLKATAGHTGQEIFYRIKCPNSRTHRVFRRLRQKGISRLCKKKIGTRDDHEDEQV